MMPTPPSFGTPVVRSIEDAVAAGIWEIIADVETVDGATQIDVTGLDGNTDEQYFFAIHGTENGNGQIDVDIRFNGDSGGNYQTQLAGGQGAGAFAVRFTDAVGFKVTEADSGREFAAYGWIGAKILPGNGVRTITNNAEGGSGAAAIEAWTGAGFWDNEVDNITSLSIVGLNGGEFAAGCRFTLMKLIR